MIDLWGKRDQIKSQPPTHSFKYFLDDIFNRDSSNKREELYSHFEETRERLIRLLVLLRWRDKIPHLEHCKILLQTLNTQATTYEQAADHLYETDARISSLRFLCFSFSFFSFSLFLIRFSIFSSLFLNFLKRANFRYSNCDRCAVQWDLSKASGFIAICRKVSGIHSEPNFAFSRRPARGCEGRRSIS